jgi:thiol-disulfide isomerase/thioredoxin
LELAVANHIFDVTTIEQRFLQKQNSPQVSQIDIGAVPNKEKMNSLERGMLKSGRYTRSPEITNPSGFVNTEGKPVTISQFKGKKVVLVDFWTYSCINCKRTLPYMKAWYDKYHDQGLEIISIHTPEFGFEKVQSNVEMAVKEEGIKYPVVLDNDYGTWTAFANQFWPRKYLIDIDGYIVYDHAGEGEYDVTEQAIQKALKERSEVLGATTTAVGMVTPSGVVTVDAGKVQSPETYFGQARNEYLGNGDVGKKGLQALIIPEKIKSDTLYLGGEWNFTDEYAEGTKSGSSIVYSYNAKDVYFVASSVKGVRLKITLDGKPIGEQAGSDVDSNGEVVIQENRLYTLVHGKEYGEHILRIEVVGEGLDAYTFTFG